MDKYNLPGYYPKYVYRKANGGYITKDGHTMFLQDVVADLRWMQGMLKSAKAALSQSDPVREQLVEALKEILYESMSYYELLPNTHRMTAREYYYEQVNALHAAGASVEGECPECCGAGWKQISKGTAGECPVCKGTGTTNNNEEK